MKIYIDYVFIINFLIDFMILLSTGLILKRKINIIRIFIGSIFGGLTIILLFIKVNSFLLFIIKFIFSVFMIIISFSYRDFKYFINNIIYLYLVSIFIGGGIYLIDLDFFYKRNGLFVFKSGKLNIILVLFFINLFLVFLYKVLNRYRNNYCNYMDVLIKYKSMEYKYIGFIDSGNNLRDPYKNRPISILYNKCFDIDDDFIFVSYETCSGSGILKCIKVDLIINGKLYKNSLIGLSDKDFKMDGVDILLNNRYGGYND